ncbi:hypothetical protein FB566_1540 [Stackebrandtia endophytica]|uniref:Leucine rich repeat (LRR) protein n=1 Tax=Stackebrandtia endophytica TaxID=1496996 RepID=A0A543ATU0_9ACTN|nr:STM4015 family protein [Stackebrandtia endophytica]TQL76020.1 hypothetical protein FB566_1540 [Stackebrandtia endophytica]
MSTGHLTNFVGLPVVDFLSEGAKADHTRYGGPNATDVAALSKLADDAATEPALVAWRLRVVEDVEEFPDYLDRFTREVDTTRISALVIGDWGVTDAGAASTEARDALIAKVAAFPALRALFFGDITSEEYEISWITQSDMAPLLTAFPLLEEFTVRGVGDGHSGPGLALEIPEHDALRSLTVQSGGLPGRIIGEIASSALPALERLELWLGVNEYGGDAVPADIATVLSDEAFPLLTHLGLRNSEETGIWLQALTQSAVLPRLTSVDLSLGTLRDDDVDLLLSAIPKLAHLAYLDLHHHYLTDAKVKQVKAACQKAGLIVNLGNKQEPDEWDGEKHYYPAVGE